MRLSNLILISAAAFLFIASFDEFNLGAEALIRKDSTPDSEYIVRREDYPGIVAINNYFDNCKSGKNTCVMRTKELMKMKKDGQTISMHGRRSTPKKGAKATWNVSCGGTVVGRRHIMSARHCFCADPSGAFGYTSGFYVWVKNRKYKVKRTMVPKGCGWSCHETGHPNQCDIAIMELEKPITHVKPYKIYSPKRCSRKDRNGRCTRHFGSELHKNLEFYGWGVPGVASSASSKVCENGALDGKMRKGMNTVLSLGNHGTSWGRHKDHILKFMMRGGSNPKLCKLFPFTKFAGINRCHPGEGLRLEAITSSGDSGTPAFIRMRNSRGREELYIAGIDTSGDKTAATDVNTCGYGAIDEFSRISKFSNFIRHAMSGRAFKKRGKKFGRTQEPWTMTKRAPGMNFAPFGHADYKRTNCRAMMEKYWIDNAGWAEIAVCGKNYNVGKKSVQANKARRDITKMLRRNKDPSRKVYTFGRHKMIVHKKKAHRKKRANTIVHLAKKMKTRVVRKPKRGAVHKLIKHAVKKAMHKKTKKHIKQAVNDIVSLASRKGFAKWKKLQKGHLSKDQMNRALQHQIDQATDAQFHKLHLPTNMAEIPEFELLQNMHDSEHHTAKDIHSKTQLLKAQYESQIKSLSAMLK